MAKKLSSLIRLHEWQVDGKRLKLAGCLRLLEDLEAQVVNLEKEVKTEQRIAGNSPSEAGFLYGAYAEQVIQRRNRLAASTVQAEGEVAAAREELNQAYRDLKKYETVQANRDRREAREMARKDQEILDEVGLQAHVRRG